MKTPSGETFIAPTIVNWYGPPRGETFRSVVPEDNVSTYSDSVNTEFEIDIEDSGPP
jgi:hypothetical protein